MNGQEAMESPAKNVSWRKSTRSYSVGLKSARRQRIDLLTCVKKTRASAKFQLSFSQDQMRIKTFKKAMIWVPAATWSSPSLTMQWSRSSRSYFLSEANLLITAIFPRSSRYEFTGVSNIIGRLCKTGWPKIALKPWMPISPRPMCSCLSNLDREYLGCRWDDEQQSVQANATPKLIQSCLKT